VSESLDDKVEREAIATGCPRHRSKMRACAYHGDEPCKCRERVLRREEALTEMARMDGKML